MVKLFMTSAFLVLLASPVWGGPMQVDGDITVAGSNKMNVTSVGGTEAYILGGVISASDGLVEDASTNVGGVNVHNTNVGRNEDITVINNNRGSVTNYGEKVSVGGVQLGKKYK